MHLAVLQHRHTGLVFLGGRGVHEPHALVDGVAGVLLVTVAQGETQLGGCRHLAIPLGTHAVLLGRLDGCVEDLLGGGVGLGDQQLNAVLLGAVVVGAGGEQVGVGESDFTDADGGSADRLVVVRHNNVPFFLSVVGVQQIGKRRLRTAVLLSFVAFRYEDQLALPLVNQRFQ